MAHILYTCFMAFLVGGATCAVGQLILEYTSLTPAHVLVSFTVIGGILAGLGLYEPLINMAGAGVLIPVSGFGNSVATGAIMEAKRLGLLGAFTGVFEFTGLGLTAAVVFGFIIALIAKPKE